MKRGKKLEKRFSRDFNYGNATTRIELCKLGPKANTRRRSPSDTSLDYTRDTFDFVILGQSQSKKNFFEDCLVSEKKTSASILHIWERTWIG